MATAKKKASKKTATRKASTPQPLNEGGPPKGMKPIVGGYAKTWNVEEFNTLEGSVNEPVKSVELRQGRKTVERKCVEVKTDDGERYTVWESAGLVNLFDAIGDAKLPCRVWIQFTGFGTAKKGQNAPKLFEPAIG